MRVFLFVVLMLWTCPFGHGTEDEEHGHENSVDPYDEILTLFNISTNSFGGEALQEVLDKFAERFECGHHDHGADETCQLAFCVNSTTLLNTLAVGASGNIDEETFENIAFFMLAVASNVNNETCHDHIDPTLGTLEYHQNKLTLLLSSYGSATGVGVDGVQEFLEGLHIAEDDDHDDDDHDHDDDDEHGHEEEEGDLDEEMHGEEEAKEGHAHDHEGEGHEGEGHEGEGHEEEGHDEHEELFTDNCLGGDVLFHQLQLGITDAVPMDDVGHFASLIVYHILKGSHVSHDCRKLPRQEFFPLSIFRQHGVNDTINQTAFKELMEELGIGGAHTGSEVIDEHEGHDHRRRRSVGQTDFLYQDAWNGMCITSDQLMAIYDVDGDVTMTQFSTLCPALVQQQLSKACLTARTPEEHSDDGKPSLTERYGYGTIATFIICVVSVIGAAFVRCGSQVSKDRMLHLFIGLAVGTLVSDALIHLIPQAFGVHGHGADDGHDHEGEGIVVEPYVWVAMVTCGGIYLFYLLELLMSSTICCQHPHSHSEEVNADMEIKVSENGKKYQLNGGAMGNIELPTSTKGESRSCGLAPVAYMVIIGDSVHNFLDGLAIGASFSNSVTLGVSTSIAVLCHEVPHELGDFAILLKSGMPFCRAMAVNFLSALTAMVGFYVGVAIATNETTERWIIAATAGMFLYISLVSMLPEMLKQAKSSKSLVLLNNVGMLLGVAIMVVIAVFEEKIKIN